MMRNLTVTLATSGHTYNLATLILADTNVVTDTTNAIPFPTMCKQVIMQTAVGTVTFMDGNGDTGPVYATTSIITLGPFDTNTIDLNSIYVKGGSSNTTIALTILD